MGDFLSKLENFLFDILGLALPGIIFLFMLFLPSYCLDFSKIPNSWANNSFILSGLETISRLFHQEFKANVNLILIIVIILAYLTGHVVKVFSIILYEIMSTIFDKTLNPVVVKFLGLIEKAADWVSLKIFGAAYIGSNTQNFFSMLTFPVRNIVNKVFTFKSSEYFHDNDSLRTDCINKINSKLGTTYPDKWYSLYKFSKILNSQEKISSLSDHFLAKYNLYRSLSFVFLFTIFYYYSFFVDAANYISPELSKIKMLVLMSAVIFWFTFHYKYKRYWTLCGNETLMSLYYYLNKSKLNAP